MSYWHCRRCNEVSETPPEEHRKQRHTGTPVPYEVPDQDADLLSAGRVIGVIDLYTAHSSWVGAGLLMCHICGVPLTGQPSKKWCRFCKERGYAWRKREMAKRGQMVAT